MNSLLIVKSISCVLDPALLAKCIVLPLCGLSGWGVRHSATDRGQKNRDEVKYGGHVEAEGRMAGSRELIRQCLLALFLLPQESFQKVLAFLFELVRFGRAFE